MIAVAIYPNNFCLEQGVLSSFWNNFSQINQLSTAYQKYKPAHDHYTQVRNWCVENLSGPYCIDVNDILYDGVRVRVGKVDDLAYFALKWC